MFKSSTSGSSTTGDDDDDDEYEDVGSSASEKDETADSSHDLYDPNAAEADTEDRSNIQEFLEVQKRAAPLQRRSSTRESKKVSPFDANLERR